MGNSLSSETVEKLFLPCDPPPCPPSDVLLSSRIPRLNWNINQTSIITRCKESSVQPRPATLINITQPFVPPCHLFLKISRGTAFNDIFNFLHCPSWKDFLMYFCYCVINIKIIHLILVRLPTTSGYVGHCSKKDGRGAQLPPAEQNHCLQSLMRGLIPHDLIILHKQTHANCVSAPSC